MNKLAKQRLSLWNKHPYCHWCGCITVYVDRQTKDIVKRKTMPFQDNEATIDHLYSRFDNRRGKNSHIQRNVLSCYKCNHKRAEIEEKNLDKSILHKKSNSHPISEKSIEELKFIEEKLLLELNKVNNKNRKIFLENINKSLIKIRVMIFSKLVISNQ